MAGDGLAVFFLLFVFFFSYLGGSSIGVSSLGGLIVFCLTMGFSFFVSYFLSSLVSFFSAARSYRSSLNSWAANKACETTCVVVWNLTESLLKSNLFYFDVLTPPRLPDDDPRPDFISFRKLISVGSTYKLSIVVFYLGFIVYEALRLSFESFVSSRRFSGSRILFILRKLDFEGFAAGCTAYSMD